MMIRLASCDTVSMLISLSVHQKRKAPKEQLEAERSLFRASLELSSQIWHRKSMKSMEERRPEVGRWEFLLEAPILFRIEAEMELLWRFVAELEQRYCLLQNSCASVNRSVRRTNWNEQEQTEQLVWSR